MRLIDAEKCPCNGCGVMYCYKNCKEYDEWFNGCDYDVEAKVVELEELKSYESGCLGVSCDKCRYNESCLEGEEAYKVALDKAISIVRGRR